MAICSLNIFSGYVVYKPFCRGGLRSVRAYGAIPPSYRWVPTGGLKPCCSCTKVHRTFSKDTHDRSRSHGRLRRPKSTPTELFICIIFIAFLCLCYYASHLFLGDYLIVRSEASRAMQIVRQVGPCVCWDISFPIDAQEVHVP